MRVVLAAVLTGLALAQGGTHPQQQPSARSNWPCGGRLDPSYFQLAEGTGGELLMIAPWEIAGSSSLMMATDQHPQTIFRLGGTINPGTHEFRVPIDASVDSVVFSVAVQCLQTAEILDPSGRVPSGDGVTDFASFVAERMVVVNHPPAGSWTIRVAGSGVAGVMVKARSAVAVTDVEFAPGGTDRFSRLPVAGVENAVRIRMAGRPSGVEASIVDAAAKEISALALIPGDEAGVYVARFTPGAKPFRVLVRGTAGGAPFQRLHAPLLTAR